MQNKTKTGHYLDKFTGRKVQEGMTTRQTLLPDSLEAWMECYLRLSVSGIRSEAVAQKRSSLP
jgi:hypothetical protein